LRETRHLFYLYTGIWGNKTQRDLPFFTCIKELFHAVKEITMVEKTVKQQISKGWQVQGMVFILHTEQDLSTTENLTTP